MAVDPPLAVREQLVEWARGVAAAAREAGSARGSLRLLDAESLHLTLCFLGSRPVGEIDALAAALAAGAEDACELSVGAPLWLPPRRPRALAVEIHDATASSRACTSGSAASSRASAAGARAAALPAPHHARARAREGGGRRRARSDRSHADGSARERSLPATPQLSFTPEAIVLYRSWLAPEGASYEALATRGLAAAAR